MARTIIQDLRRHLAVRALTLVGAGVWMLPTVANSSLEAQSQTEFNLAGRAVATRLEREAAGDTIGARIAQQELDAHRFRYLDLKRDLARAQGTAAATPSVAALRSPFVPDATFSDLRYPASRSAAVIRAYPVKEIQGASSWDMYRRHERAAEVGVPDTRISSAQPPQPLMTSTTLGMYSSAPRAPEHFAEALEVASPKTPVRVHREALPRAPGNSSMFAIPPRGLAPRGFSPSPSTSTLTEALP